MDAYLRTLESSTFPIPQWGLLFAWLILFIGSNALHRRGLTLAGSQAHISMGAPFGLVLPFSARLVLAQIIFSVAVFALASLAGGAGFAFLAGGWVTVTAVSFALNLRSTLYLAALAKPDTAEGSLKLSNRLVVRNHAFQLLGAAALCFSLGVLIAHLALLGGALFLAAASIGYLRKANAPRP